MRYTKPCIVILFFLVVFFMFYQWGDKGVTYGGDSKREEETVSTPRDEGGLSVGGSKLEEEIVNTEIQNTFSRIYNTSYWGIDGGGSGGGSSLESTVNTRNSLKEIIKNFKIKSILDAPCGAMVWMSVFLEDIEKEFPDITYHGCDVVPSVIENNQKKFKEKHPNWNFSICDITHTHFPQSDLILTRQVLQHLPIKKHIRVF